MLPNGTITIQAREPNGSLLNETKFECEVKKMLLLSNEMDVPKPELTAFPFNLIKMPLIDFMRQALSISRQCEIEMKITETEDRYRFDFYFHRSTVMGKSLTMLCNLFEGSEMFVLQTKPAYPDTILATFYRIKESTESKES